MGTDRHKRNPISLRPPQADLEWLEEHSRQTGLPVRQILLRALAEYRQRAETASQHDVGVEGVATRSGLAARSRNGGS